MDLLHICFIALRINNEGVNEYMLKLKELINRVYEQKRCVSFEININNDTLPESIFLFKKIKNCDKPTWNLTVMISKDRDRDSQVYNFSYELPREGIPLEMIAAIGLKYFQLKIQEEVQMKSNFNFVLSDILQGM